MIAASALAAAEVSRWEKIRGVWPSSSKDQPDISSPNPTGDVSIVADASEAPETEKGDKNTEGEEKPLEPPLIKKSISTGDFGPMLLGHGASNSALRFLSNKPSLS